MHTTTSLPALSSTERSISPGPFSSNPLSSNPLSSNPLSAWRSTLRSGAARLLGRPVFVGRHAFKMRRLMAFLEARVDAAERRSLPIVVGDATHPFDATEPGAMRGLHALLETLKRHSGLEVVITSDSPLLLREIDALVELDQNHAVAVDVPVPCVDPVSGELLDLRAAEPQQCLWMVRKLAEQGLTTRMLLPLELDSEDVLRPLISAARAYGAFDVVSAAGSSSRLLRQLRLENDLPRHLPGRG